MEKPRNTNQNRACLETDLITLNDTKMLETTHVEYRGHAREEYRKAYRVGDLLTVLWQVRHNTGYVDTVRMSFRIGPVLDCRGGRNELLSDYRKSHPSRRGF